MLALIPTVIFTASRLLPDGRRRNKLRAMRLSRFLLACGLSLSSVCSFGGASSAVADDALTGVHALALHDKPKYAPDFKHFSYVNPDAPKGGTVRLGGFGGFDSLNPFILKGESAEGLSLMYDTLMVSSADEAFSEYGLLAKSVDVAADRSWTAFTLRDEATFSDGTPVLAEDVVWTFNTLVEKGSPYYRSYYASVEKVEAEGERRVKFTFKDKGNRELPLIIGQMVVLPKHYWEGKAFDQSSLAIPLGSGPYRIEAVEAGRSLTYARRDDYWGKDLAVNKGRYNFDKIRYDYYKDLEVMFQAFKAGEIDFRLENSAQNWSVGYNVPAVKDGRLVKEIIPNEDPQGMQGFVFNTRRAQFADGRVRKAIALMMDFEWMNKNLFYGQYTRTQSYFANSELACACASPPKGAELSLLSRFKEQLPPAVFFSPVTMPKTDGSGSVRAQMKEALDLLGEAGYALRDGKMTNDATGEPLTIEILLVQDNFVRVAQPFVKNLARLGIKASVRLVDSAQYINRLNAFDFDMIVHSFGQSLSPGNEQVNYWTMARADINGSGNMAGVKDPVVDALVETIIRAQNRNALVTAVHALDRVLLHGWYVIPQWHLSAHRVAYWNRFDHPAVAQKYGFGFVDTWWVNADKDAVLMSKNR